VAEAKKKLPSYYFYSAGFHTKMEWVRLQPAFIIAMSSYMYDLKKRTRIFVGDADPVLIPG
jgi:hypothetical protein